MSKPKDFVNFVVVGSRYQVLNEKGEATSEFGVGVFRAGIHLKLAEKLFVELVSQAGPGLYNGASKKTARELAAHAFALGDVFLEEMDKHFRRPPPPPPPSEEEKINSDRFKG